MKVEEEGQGRERVAEGSNGDSEEEEQQQQQSGGSEGGGVSGASRLLPHVTCPALTPAPLPPPPLPQVSIVDPLFLLPALPTSPPPYPPTLLLLALQTCSLACYQPRSRMLGLSSLPSFYTELASRYHR